MQPRCPSTDEWIKKLWYKYMIVYYSAIKRNEFESVLVSWMNLMPVTHSEVSQKEKNKYGISMHICGLWKDGTEAPVCRAAMEMQMWRIDLWPRRGQQREARFGRVSWKRIDYRV